jgi:hypothetical protein
MPYETDERLKSYLDTNQLARERMCLALLRIDKRFTDVRPRHPRGGPDGARDMEAVFNGAQGAFGAVGFVNQASDTEEYKKKAMKKFADDLTEALKQNPRPDVFVFFTNVNLTVAEKDQLIRDAKARGLALAEIVDRERLRIVLDSVDGLIARQQYLDIPLSEAEQAAFFARWGDDIQGVIADGFGRLQGSLNRILFLQEANLPLLNFTVLFDLEREYSAQEIGHFRAFALVHLKQPRQGTISWICGATDNVARIEAHSREDLARGKSGIAHGVCGGQWEMEMPTDEEGRDEVATLEEEGKSYTYKRTVTFHSVGRNPVKTIGISYTRDLLIRLLPGPRLLDLDECMFIFSLNRQLAVKVKAIRVYANEYKLAELRSEIFRLEEHDFERGDSFLFFTEEELTDPWVRLGPQNASTFRIRLSEQTPKRIYSAAEVIEATDSQKKIN